MRNFLKLIILFFGLLFLVSCGSNSPSRVPSASSVQPDSATPSILPDVSINIRSAERTTRPLTKKFTYDHCAFDVPTEMTIGFGQVLSESFTEELVLKFGADVGMDVQSVVKASIEAAVEKHFISEKKQVYESNQVASFPVPPRSYQIYIVNLTETLREGELSFTYNGETHGVRYSYRINLEGAGANPISLPCPPYIPGGNGATQPVVPIPVAYESCESGFDASVWSPASTEDYFMPLHIGPCWQLEKYGLTMANETIWILEDDGPAKASWYGVTRSVPTGVSIRMNVHLERLLGGAEIWIGLTDSPSNIENGKFLAIKKAARAIPGYISAFSVEGRNAGLRYTVFDNVFDPNDTGNYFIEMKLDSNRLSIWLNHSPARAFSPVEVSVYQRYLFIGYLATTQVNIDAQISDIQILP